MKLFLIFFPSLALVHKPCRLMGFLLILKESHEGKNVLNYYSYCTIPCLRLVNAASPRTISVDKKKISSGTQGK